MQIDAGAQALMIFDTWGGILADGIFQQFSLHYILNGSSINYRRKRTVSPSPSWSLRAVADYGWMTSLPRGADAVGVDWTVNLADAKARNRSQGRPTGQP